MLVAGCTHFSTVRAALVNPVAGGEGVRALLDHQDGLGKAWDGMHPMGDQPGATG